MNPQGTRNRKPAGGDSLNLGSYPAYSLCEVRYWPNPAHKSETTEAGPPVWRPDKEKCPDDMTVTERDDLLAASIPLTNEPQSRRFAVRRTNQRLELFDVKCHGTVDGEPEFHGHPRPGFRHECCDSSETAATSAKPSIDVW